MPIPAVSAGSDGAVRARIADPIGAGRATLDDVGRERGRVGLPQQRAAQFRAALFEAAASAAEPAPAAGPPRQAILPPADALQGVDALAALRADLASGGVATPPPASAAEVDTAAAAGPDGAPMDAAAAAEATQQNDASPPVSWHHDDTRGRRLGDHPAVSAGEDGVETWLFGEDGFGFDDLVDIINPLQHIPIVSSIYRWITGDEMGPAATVAGGALFGGPIGLAGALASVAIEESTGDDLGGHAIAMMLGDEPATPAEADLAAAPPLHEMETGAMAVDGTAPAQLAGLGTPPAPVPDAPREFTGAIPTSPLPAIGRSVAFIPASPGASTGNDVSVAPAGPGRTEDAPVSPADAAIAAQMMDALRKYEALVQARVGTAPSMEPAAGTMVDSTL